MRSSTDSMRFVGAAWLIVVLVPCGMSRAENVDPANDGSQYAYAENVGWINAEPSGDGGPGVEVADFELTGWMWAENLGWINLFCKNRTTCDTAAFGVRNDGTGVLSGEAWAENGGWILFRTSTGGVTVDVSTGEFAGHAWSENAGWITFASTGPTAYNLRTAWTCDPPPLVPPDVLDAHLQRSGGRTRLTWTSLPTATGYDVLVGDLSTLRSTAGDFSIALNNCVGDNVTATVLDVPGDPTVGEGTWYLVRPVNCGGVGRYESDGAGQVGSRDLDIGGHSDDCPAP